MTAARGSERGPTPDDGADTETLAGLTGTLTGTKLKIAEATLKTLKQRGYAGTSAREIAATGSFNQALIFYHFGGVQTAMLAALDLVGARRMQAYRPEFQRAQTLPELAALARKIHAEDLENGYVTVLGELVAGGVSDATLGSEVIARLEPWIELVSDKLRELLAGSPLQGMLPPGDLAFAIVALYLGADMLSHLAGEHTRAASLLDLSERYAPVLDALLPSRTTGRAG
jgi:AcrR family transcriptional regulator